MQKTQIPNHHPPSIPELQIISVLSYTIRKRKKNQIFVCKNQTLNPTPNSATQQQPERKNEQDITTAIRRPELHGQTPQQQAVDRTRKNSGAGAQRRAAMRDAAGRRLGSVDSIPPESKTSCRNADSERGRRRRRRRGGQEEGKAGVGE